MPLGQPSLVDAFCPAALIAALLRQLAEVIQGLRTALLAFALACGQLLQLTLNYL
jgi:hypothetical protein